MTRGVRADSSRRAQRYRRSLPTTRRQPAVATVLHDAVALAKAEVDKLTAKSRAEGLTNADVKRLETLVNTLDRAQRTDERVMAALGDGLAGESDAELHRLAAGGRMEDGNE